MNSVIPPGDPAKIVIAGKRQGFLGLAIHYTATPCGSPVMETAWQPTLDELARINAGAPILIKILGVPPINPMIVEVGNAPALVDIC
jgi:hypothetical protein